jgi:hypothetical protein
MVCEQEVAGAAHDYMQVRRADFLIEMRYVGPIGKQIPALRLCPELHEL